MSEIKISKREYDKLQRASRKLEALEAGGVDNWEWYSESLKQFNEEEAFSELLEEYTNSILEECSLGGDVDYPAGREAGHSIMFDSEVEDTIQSLLRKFYQAAKGSEEE